MYGDELYACNQCKNGFVLSFDGTECFKVPTYGAIDPPYLGNCKVSQYSRQFCLICNDGYFFKVALCKEEYGSGKNTKKEATLETTPKINVEGSLTPFNKDILE